MPVIVPSASGQVVTGGPAASDGTASARPVALASWHRVADLGSHVLELAGLDGADGLAGDHGIGSTADRTETSREIVTAALDAAGGDLRDALGSESGWAWGRPRRRR